MRSPCTEPRSRLGWVGLECGMFDVLQVEQVERGLKQAELDGRRKTEEVQAVKNKVVLFVCLVV